MEFASTKPVQIAFYTDILDSNVVIMVVKIQVVLNSDNRSVNSVQCAASVPNIQTTDLFLTKLGIVVPQHSSFTIFYSIA